MPICSYIVYGGFLVKRQGVVAHACNPSNFGKPRWADHLRSGVSGQTGKHGETLSLLRIQKLARRGSASASCICWGGWGRRIAWTWEVEVAVSWDSITALLPGRESENQFWKKKRKKREIKEEGRTEGRTDGRMICGHLRPLKLRVGKKIQEYWLLPFMHICMLGKPSIQYY